jgi:hypothetical protein
MRRKIAMGVAFLIAVLAIAPMAVHADTIQVGTLNITSSGLGSGQATITNDMSDTDLEWEPWFIGGTGRVLSSTITPGETTPIGVGWGGYPSFTQFLADGILSSGQFTVDGVLYNADPTKAWFVRWTGASMGTLPIDITADPVVSPEPGTLALLIEAVAGLATIVLWKKRST